MAKGQSGSGKSTLLALLLRFHDPTRGTVSFDGHDLSRATPASFIDEIRFSSRPTAPMISA